MTTDIFGLNLFLTYAICVLYTCIISFRQLLTNLLLTWLGSEMKFILERESGLAKIRTRKFNDSPNPAQLFRFGGPVKPKYSLSPLHFSWLVLVLWTNNLRESAGPTLEPSPTFRGHKMRNGWAIYIDVCFYDTVPIQR
jgi:hypothetical protein